MRRIFILSDVPSFEVALHSVHSGQVSTTEWFIEAFSYTDVEEWAIELSLTDGDTNDFTFSSSVSTVSFAVEAERVDAESDLLLSATPFVHVQCARFPMTNVVHTE